MTIKLGNLSDWRVLEGNSLVFEAPDYDRDKPRRVRLDLNQEVGCNWYVKTGTREARFLALIPAGLQTLEFVFDGDFEISPVVPDDAEIHYWTSEAEAFWKEGDGESFSTIYERQPRNEALEWVQFQAMQNQLRRDRAHAEELEKIRALVESNGKQSRIYGEQTPEHKEPAGIGSEAEQAAGATAGGGRDPAGDGDAGAGTARERPVQTGAVK